MRVLRYIEPRHLELGEIPCPGIGPGEVLVRLQACGICATDVKTYLRGHPFIGAGSVLGHEMTGVIAESQAEGWAAGERVVVAPYVPCGECAYCARGQYTLCEHLYDASAEPGGFSEFVRVPARLVQTGLLRLPEGIDFTLGSLVEPLACCYFGLEALAVKPGDSVLVIGDGPMGLMQAILARDLGAAPVVVAGMTPARLALAARFADHVINVGETKLEDAIRSLTQDAGIDKVVVAVGQPEVAENAMALVRRGGSINFFAGLPSHSRISIDPNRIHYDLIKPVGTSGFAPSHFRWALAALPRNAAPLRSLITRTVPWAELAQAFEESARYEGVKMVAELA